MKDNKNERNASEQFSPEELIRKLKFQLSGEASTPDPVPPQNNDDTPPAADDSAVSENTLEDPQESEDAFSVTAAAFDEPADAPEETSPAADEEEPEAETAFELPADETPDPALADDSADLPQIRFTAEEEDGSVPEETAAADETAQPVEAPAMSLSFEEEEKDASAKDAFLAYIRSQVMQGEDEKAAKPLLIPELEEITVPAEKTEKPAEESGNGEEPFNFFANLEEKAAEEAPAADVEETEEKPTIAFDLSSIRSESPAPAEEPDPADDPDLSDAPDFSTVSFSPAETDADADTDGIAPAAAREAFGSNKPNINMLIALGISVSEVENIYGKEVAEEFAEAKAKEGQLDTEEFSSESAYEYTAASQNDEVVRYFKKEKTVSLVKLIASAAIFFLLFLFENLPLFGVRYTGWMNQADFPLVHVMVDLQLVLIAAALAFEELIDGATGLFKKTPDIRSFAFCATVLNVIAAIVIACTKAAATARLSGFSAVFVLTVCLLVSYLKTRADADNFAVVSTTGLKACCFADNDESVAKEKAAFAKELEDENPKVISFGNAHFVENFFNRIQEKTPTLADRILIPAALIALAAVAVLAAVKSKNVSYTLSVLNTAIAAFFPVSVFAAGIFSFVKAQRLAHEAKSAIIGDAAPYVYSGASVVTFRDKDVYPSYCVKLRNLKVYGNAEIEEVLRTAAVVFRETGGPLSDVFEYATSDLDKSERATVVRSGDSGLECEVGGKRVLIGKADFLQSYGIIPFSDVDDRDYLKTGDVGIMYVCIDSELCAKFYVQYTMDVDFEDLLRALNKSGICVAIRTSDPNIDQHLLQAKLNLRRASLRIIHVTPDGTAGEAYSAADSGVVGNGSSNELVGTMLLCDRIVHVLRTNNILKCVSVFAGIFLLLLTVLFAPNALFFSFWLVLYQFFWMIPTFVLSKLFL